MANKKEKEKPKQVSKLDQYKNQVKAMNSDQLKQQKQHMEEEIEWFKYQSKISQRGIEYLDTSLKYEIWKKKKEIEELEGKIKESTNPTETEYLRSQLWFANIEKDEGLNLKATRKRKELMSQVYNYKKRINSLQMQLGIITDRLEKLTKKLEKDE